jgi:nicotinamide mononucleotide transporter
MIITTIFSWLQYNYIELIAAVAGIAGVWLTTKQIIWCWPVALVNVVLYIFVFFKAKLYADFGLQLFYLVLTLYGWYHWLYGSKDQQILPISRLKINVLGVCLLIGMPGFIIVGFLLQRFTDAALPFIDSFIAVWGIIGTWMMARKILEHWLLWIVVDLIGVGIYLVKDLYATAILYFIFTILAVYGFVQWKKAWMEIK